MALLMFADILKPKTCSFNEVRSAFSLLVFTSINPLLQNSLCNSYGITRLCIRTVLHNGKVSSLKDILFWPLSAVSYLQNIIPALLVENIVLKVFSVYILGLLYLLWSHYLSWRGVEGGRGREKKAEAQLDEKIDTFHISVQ